MGQQIVGEVLPNSPCWPRALERWARGVGASSAKVQAWSLSRSYGPARLRSWTYSDTKWLQGQQTLSQSKPQQTQYGHPYFIFTLFLNPGEFPFPRIYLFYNIALKVWGSAVSTQMLFPAAFKTLLSNLSLYKESTKPGKGTRNKANSTQPLHSGKLLLDT